MPLLADAPPALATYEAMAPVYDRFTGHHDYEAWTTTLEGLAVTAGLSGQRLLDAACGSGKSFAPMLARGYDVTGVELSPAMLERAHARSAGAARLVEGDLRTFDLGEEFDLVWCLCDAINYVTSPEDLVRAVDRLAAHVAPGGVLLFDCNNLLAYRSFFAETVRVDDVVWRGRAGAGFGAGEVALADVTIGGDASCTHVQRHHPRDEVMAALERAGLARVRVNGQHPTGAVDDDADELVHMKTVYIATRERR
jgi:SAM-dependent methyltransferase